MTNEEIEEAAAKCLELSEDDIGGMKNAYSEVIPCDLEKRIATAIRDAVSQAYEEAARIADRWADDPVGVEWHWAAEQIAKESRALKDSLVSEPVSS